MRAGSDAPYDPHSYNPFEEGARDAQGLVFVVAVDTVYLIVCAHVGLAVSDVLSM